MNQVKMNELKAMKLALNKLDAASEAVTNAHMILRGEGFGSLNEEIDGIQKARRELGYKFKNEYRQFNETLNDNDSNKLHEFVHGE